jgi:iron complex outermembrane receptor protein
VEDDGRAIVGVLPGGTPTFFQFQGNHDFLSEELIALEAGYRLQPLETVTLDVATFHNRYDHLRTTSAGAVDASNFPNYVVQILDARNDMKGLTWGIEVAALWQIHEKIRLQAGYTFFQRRFHLINGSGDVTARDSDEASPHHIGYLRLSLDPAKDVQIDLIGRYTGPITPRDISDYFEADARVAWHFLPSAEAALVGQCLARTSHREEDNSILGTQFSRVQRGVYASLTLRF